MNEDTQTPTLPPASVPDVALRQQGAAAPDSGGRSAAPCDFVQPATASAGASPANAGISAARQTGITKSTYAPIRTIRLRYSASWSKSLCIRCCHRRPSTASCSAILPCESALKGRCVRRGHSAGFYLNNAIQSYALRPLSFSIRTSCGGARSGSRRRYAT